MRALALCLALLTIMACVPGAQATLTLLPSPTLPAPAMAAAAVWDANRSVAYNFGGLSTSGVALDTIVEYDPAAGTTAIVARLPKPTHNLAAVWDGTSAYLVGGMNFGSVITNEILKWTPGSPPAVVAYLPRPLFDTVSLWDGTSIYILGGGAGASTAVYQYTPSTGAMLHVGAMAPGIQYSSGVWTGTEGYIFGGHTGSGATNVIYRVTFNPFLMTPANAMVIPSGRYDHASIWDGHYAYIFGGMDSPSTTSAQILRFDPATGLVVVMCDKFPFGRAQMTALTTASGKAIILGGAELVRGIRNEIYHFQDTGFLVPGTTQCIPSVPLPPLPNLPCDVTAEAEAGPTGGSVHIVVGSIGLLGLLGSRLLGTPRVRSNEPDAGAKPLDY